MIIRTSFSAGMFFFQYTHLYKYNPLLVVIYLLLIVIFNYLLIPPFGMLGAAGASFLADLIHVLVKGLVLGANFRFVVVNFRFLLVLIIGVVIWLAISYLPENENLFLDVSIKAVLITLSYWTVIFKLRISKRLNNRIMIVWTNIRSRK